MRQRKHVEFWVNPDGNPVLYYPDGTVEYWAGNDPRPHWCRYYGSKKTSFFGDRFISILK